MNKIHYRRNYIILFVFSTFVFSSCSKELQDAIDGTGTSSALEQYFEANVLNQNFTINLATNNGVDLTPNYAGYLFKMMKTDYYHGPATATKGTTVYTGTWSSNSD